MPPCYVTTWQTYAGHHRNELKTFATVHDSATGAALATVRMPPLTSPNGADGPALISAADDRTFLVTEMTTGARFYLLRVSADGRSVSFTALPVSVPDGLFVSDAALSPDRSKIAMAARDCTAKTCPYTGIRVVTLATGAVRSWTTHLHVSPGYVSWAGNDLVAFDWTTGWRGSGRLVNVTSAGGDLMAAPAIAAPSAVALAGGGDYPAYVPPALVTADGKAVITSAFQNIPEGNGRDTVIAKIIELSARTGQRLRVLYTATARHVTTGPDGNALVLDQSCQVVSLGPSGVQPLVDCFDFGRVENGRLTPLLGYFSASSTDVISQDAAW